MGTGCSKCSALEPIDTQLPSNRQDSPDPDMYDLMRRSVEYTGQTGKLDKDAEPGQYHLLFKHHKKLSDTSEFAQREERKEVCPTRLVVRRHSLRHTEEGMSGTHIYAIRYPSEKPLGVRARRDASVGGQEQAPRRKKSVSKKHTAPSTLRTLVEPSGDKWPELKEKKEEGSVDYLFKPSAMSITPKQRVTDWVTISAEHNIYVADVGMTVNECDHIVQVTEQVCRGQYAAYTYAKQTLGCREFPPLAHVCQPAVHSITHEILEFSDNDNLALDDREPHMVKYDVTKRERQKLDMHTDKSEWTFLIALSNGSGMDYEGGGTYFECIDSTVHVQRGHALIFPGKLRHCGQRITTGLRFLLVGFLVDKTTNREGTTTLSSATKGDLNDAHICAHA